MSIHQPVVRCGPRKKVILRAYLFTHCAKHVVQVRNISARGALLLMQMPPATRGDVLFHNGGVIVAAKVVWVKHGSVGLHFYRNLTHEELCSIAPVEAWSDESA